MARLGRFRAWMPALLLGLGASVAGPHCAKGPCAINSDCGPRRYCDPDQQCRSDCLEDRDCSEGWCDLNGRCQSGPRPDAGVPDVVTKPDAGADVVEKPDVQSPPDVPVTIDRVTPPVDMPPPPVDVPVFPDVVTPVDMVSPPDLVTPDVGSPGRYLDPCLTALDCASRDCVGAAGAPRFCTKTCATNSECGAGYLCANAGRHCVPDDTGVPCRVGDDCAFACYTTTGAARAHCTHECRAGTDCAAGYACQSVGSLRVCVEVERPCTRGSDCATSLCLGGLAGTTFRGCSSQCNTAADCPLRAPVPGPGGVTNFPQYTCQPVDHPDFGRVNVCVPPIAGVVSGGDIFGSDALGASCNAMSTDPSACRSGLCADVRGGICIQTCSVAGGCPVGYGCDADFDTTSAPITLFCAPTGSRALGEGCSGPSDCASASCHPLGFCTRICNDGYCPTGMTCRAAGTATDRTPISLCVR